MSELISQIWRLFYDIKSKCDDPDEESCESDSEIIKSEILMYTRFFDEDLPSLLERIKNEQVPEIFKTNLLWLESTFKPQINRNADIHYKIWEEFLEKYYELEDFIQEESEKEEKLKEKWISEKGFSLIKCERCGFDHWFYATKMPSNCLCGDCLKKEWEIRNDSL